MRRLAAALPFFSRPPRLAGRFFATFFRPRVVVRRLLGDRVTARFRVFLRRFFVFCCKKAVVAGVEFINAPGSKPSAMSST